jgi:hypothetical protein
MDSTWKIEILPQKWSFVSQKYDIQLDERMGCPRNPHVTCGQHGCFMLFHAISIETGGTCGKDGSNLPSQIAFKGGSTNLVQQILGSHQGSSRAGSSRCKKSFEARGNSQWRHMTPPWWLGDDQQTQWISGFFGFLSFVHFRGIMHLMWRFPKKGIPPNPPSHGWPFEYWKQLWWLGDPPFHHPFGLNRRPGRSWWLALSGYSWGTQVTIFPWVLWWKYEEREGFCRHSVSLAWLPRGFKGQVNEVWNWDRRVMKEFILWELSIYFRTGALYFLLMSPRDLGLWYQRFAWRGESG